MSTIQIKAAIAAHSKSRRKVDVACVSIFVVLYAYTDFFCGPCADHLRKIRLDGLGLTR